MAPPLKRRGFLVLGLNADHFKALYNKSMSKKEGFDFNEVHIDIKKDEKGQLYFNIDQFIGLLQFEVIDNNVKQSAVNLSKSLIELLHFAKVWYRSGEEDNGETKD